MGADLSVIQTGDQEADPLAEHLAEALGGEVGLIRRLGQGRTAVVYLAEEPALDRRIALKALRPSYTRDQQIVERFKREARAAAGVPHPNIVAVHRVGETDAGIPYFTMEYIEGETLEQRLQRKGKLPLREAVRIVNGVASALTRAHELGLVHRDVKPADVLIEKDTGRVLVSDFGLAKLVAKRQRLATLTGQGEVLGTPEYTSPEQAETGAATAKSDQYSLAVIAYRMLSGRLPFPGPTAQDFLRQHVEATPPFLLQLEPELPLEVAKAVDRGLMKEPGARYSSCDAFAESLQGAARGAPVAAGQEKRVEWWRYERVFIQGIAIYAGFAWGSLEALSWVLETFQLSSDLRRPALWIVLAAFPVAMWLVLNYCRTQSLARRPA